MDLRQRILAGSKPVKEPAPEWGCDVWLKVWSAAERAAFIAWHAATPEEERAAQFDARVLMACLCDEAGTLTMQPEDLAALAASPANGPVLDRLGTKAAELNGLFRRGAASEDSKSGA